MKGIDPADCSSNRLLLEQIASRPDCIFAISPWHYQDIIINLQYAYHKGRKKLRHYLLRLISRLENHGFIQKVQKSYTRHTYVYLQSYLCLVLLVHYLSNPEVIYKYEMENIINNMIIFVASNGLYYYYIDIMNGPQKHFRTKTSMFPLINLIPSLS